MKWAFDMDGVITANPDFFKWFTYHLKKRGNSNEVYIVSSRNPQRKKESIKELNNWGISYDELYTMPSNMARDYLTQAVWKIETVCKLKPEVWMDNEFKVYERVLGIKLDTPGTERIQI
jgi:hypothetical protein